MSSRSFKRAFVAGVACTATIAGIGAFGAGAAFADPTNTNSSSAAPAQFVAVGSDTIQSLYDGYANGYTDGTGTAQPSAASIASWLATGSSLVTPSNATVPIGANPIGRPANSGDGRAALSAAWNSNSDAYTQVVGTKSTTYAVTPESIDIARSSGQPSSANTVAANADNDELTSIPLARDAVAVAINDEPTLANAILPGTLAALYRENDSSSVAGGSHFADGAYTQSSTAPTVGDVRDNSSTDVPDEQIFDGSTWISVHPFLPFNGGSGTRQFFQQAIGGSKTDGPGIGVSDVVGGGTTGTPIIENTGAIVAQPGDIAPFSAAQWIAQKNGVAPNTVTDPNVQLVSIAGQSPVEGTAPNLTPGPLYGSLTAAAPAPGYGVFDRDVYSVVATSDFRNNAALQTLVTQTLPNSKAVTDFGFDSIPQVSADSTSYIHSKFENTGTASAQATSTSVAVTAVTGQTVSVKATVTGPVGFTIPANDTVTFKNGSTVVATAMTNGAGVATATFKANTGAQTLNLTAVYGGHSTAGNGVPAPFSSSTSSSLSYATTIVPVDTLTSVKISGTARVGSKLTASVAGQVSGSTLAYTWKAGTTTLSSASSIVIPASAYKKTITLTVLSEKAGYINSAAKTSSATGTIGLGVLSAPTPKISGTTTEGKTLTAVTGTWTSGTTLHYQWKANGASIKGATAHTFKLTSAQVGKKITVTVTGTKTDYTSVAKTSASTKAVVK